MKKSAALFAITILALAAQAQNFTLPRLAYDYKALEPHIDAQTMEIHHSKHHQAYVTNLNKAVAGTKFEGQSLEDHLLGISRRSDAIRNNAGGHYNHSLFWEILTPKKNTKLSAELENEINATFTSVDSLKKLLNQAASTRFGSGWAWLIVTPDRKLQVCSTGNQDNPLMDINPDRGIPIIGIDVWEHAYYLKYQNKRGDYLTAIWNVVNWDEVSEKYAEALKSPLLKYMELDTWKVLKEFHKVLAETYHPAEEGNLDPIKTRSSELMMNALNMKTSTIPKSIDTPELRKHIEALVKESNALHKLVKKKMKDAVIKAKLFEVHEIFHKIQEECK
ncbi:MAG: Superoxide dismutase [Crocinitomicaceae bacterium]|jgi:superoxide dismutase|nr:Superoxide dismutase [Crocinitomicaceae bacterium]